MNWRSPRFPAYLAVAALLWCLAAGVLVYVLPLATSVSSSSGGEEVTTRIRIFSGSLAEAWMLLVPVLLCALASWSAAVHRRRPLLLATVLLGLFALLGALSIGVFYVPAVVLLVLSLVTSSRVPGASDSALAGRS